jgi:outer membrane protein insertion porin family
MRGALCVLALVSAAPAATLAQEQDPPVSEVRIEAEPALAERLRAYVRVEKGKPLSPAAVRHSVELLFASGELEDVVVDSHATPAGVVVVFRPIAAPRMTGLRVRGDRVLGEKQVRRVSRLRSDEQLWQSRLEDAARDVAVELGRRGYLEARVQATPERVAGGAVALFDVHAGPIARIEEVTVVGAPAEMAALLQSWAEPRRGQPWRREPAEKAALKMRRALVERGRWRATVDAHELYDPKTAGVKLRFVVDAGPRVSLAFRGTRIPAEQRRTAERIVKQGGARSDALDEALDRLEQELHARGHRSPGLRHFEEQTPPDRLEIVYEIDAGEASQVASLRVTGVEEEGFEMPHLETEVLAALRDETLERDATSLRRALHELGFAEARVEVEVPETGGDVPVLFRAIPGTRTVVEDARVEAPSELGVDAPTLLTQAGNVYRVREIARDKAALLAAWQEAGYLHAEVAPRLEWSDDKRHVRVAFQIEPGALARVGEIVVAGLRQTRAEVVRRELGMRSGDAFSPAKLLEAQRRLQGLGIFERVSARELLGGSGESAPLVIEVEEAARASVAYGLGYAERDLLRGSVEVTLRNLMGMDRSLSSFARVSFRGSRLVATYREPRLLGKKQELFVTAFREEQDRDAFDFVRAGGQLQSARSLSQRLTLIGRLTYQHTDVFNVTVPLDEIDRQFRSSTFSGPSSSLVFDSRDDPLDPRRGRFVSADLGLSHGVLGGDSFLKTFVQAASYTAAGPRAVLALQGRLGLARTFRAAPSRLPLPDRFFAGGDYSLRGFKTDFAGPLEPGTDGELQPTGGNALLLGGIELRVTAARRFEVAAFGDVGNVFPLASQLDLGELRYSAGIGVRYKSSIGPIRVDYGYKLNRRAGEGPHQLHVTVGHAF